MAGWRAVCAIGLIFSLLFVLGAKKAQPAGVTPEEIAHARQKVVAAQHDVDEAQDALNKLADKKLRPQFEASSEWKDAQAELKEATAQRDAAVKPVLENLKKDKDYQAALKEKADLDAEVQKLRKQGASSDDMKEAADDLLKASESINKMESDATSKDEKAKAAQAKYSEAAAKVG